MKTSIESKPWGTFEGREVRLWRLVNANGMELHFSDYGGRLVKAIVPDRDGKLDNVTLGWNTLDEYVVEHGGTYYGALVGRYGNRIATASSRWTARSTCSSARTRPPASRARCTAARAASRSAAGTWWRKSARTTRWGS